MIELIKEMWYKRKARVYLKLLKACADKRREFRLKQEKYRKKHEEYSALYDQHKDI